MLLPIPDLLSADEVRAARQALETASWEDGRRTAGHRAKAVKSNLQLPWDHPTTQALGQMILGRLGQNPLFIAATLPQAIMPPQFNRYEDSGAYGDHVDNAILTPAGHDMRVRTDISCTLFFSDPAEYEGGELVIEDGLGGQRIRLPAGHMIVYPGSSVHRVTPVTSGVRFASFFWVQSMVRADRQRRILFDLDSAIQDISEDQAALPKFTKIYHDLMRLWATA